MDPHRLKETLLDIQVESPIGSNRYFAPIDQLDALVNNSNVRETLQHIYPHMRKDDCEQYANAICIQSKRIFAILLCGDYLSNQAIQQFVD
jgi:hypothetical protein